LQILQKTHRSKTEESQEQAEEKARGGAEKTSKKTCRLWFFSGKKAERKGKTNHKTGFQIYLQRVRETKYYWKRF